MAVFHFRGVSATSGKDIRGVREADSAKVLRTLLRKEGVVLTSAEESKAQEQKKARDIQLFAFLRRPTVSDIAFFTRQLAVLLRAGIALTEALGALADQAEKEELKRILSSVRQQVNQGVSFATALGEHPKTFPSLYINMVAAGEASGTLENVLDRLAYVLDNQAKLTSKVSAALAYPILMMIVGFVLVTVLMVGVVPKVAETFAQMDRALPWYTQLLIAISHGFVASWTHGIVNGALIGASLYRMIVTPTEALTKKGELKQQAKDSSTLTMIVVLVAIFLLVMEIWLRILWRNTDDPAVTETTVFWDYLLWTTGGVVIGAFFGRFQNYLGTANGRVARDDFMLKMPILGSLMTMIAVARFAQTLSTLLSSGVELLKAMTIVRAVIGNASLERVVDHATDAIAQGEGISEPLRRSGKFPPLVIHMISVGERSGQLEQMLTVVAQSYENIVEVRMAALTSLLEPLIIVFMGTAVGFIAFSILMPLIQMSEFN